MRSLFAQLLGWAFISVVSTHEALVASRIAIYVSTTFHANEASPWGKVANEPYIETRGKVIVKWAREVKYLTLVTDTAISTSDLAKFKSHHGCSEDLDFGGQTTAKEHGGSSEVQAVREFRCSAWSGARLLLTPCASAWFGTAGPCCKFDYAARDFFRGPLNGVVDWFLYSDDDLFVRPLVLQGFLDQFDAFRAFVFGANHAAPRFVGAKPRNRAARG
eukprot:CAMPEP_0172621032 /NCGR_PEP_ID=MMETSP1068-20121228/108237_1 /TAXON_ID=35684 /ORGANISM="Pseudopedinella elastica, Strain CCMP716" /LENGTH=217 /DNA_ID=CAMNT_0013428561 /DNA_START=48 /DNA_END=698 /DNA_ORIENTATION=+